MNGFDLLMEGTLAGAEAAHLIEATQAQINSAYTELTAQQALAKAAYKEIISCLKKYKKAIEKLKSCMMKKGMSSINIQHNTISINELNNLIRTINNGIRSSKKSSENLRKAYSRVSSRAFFL